MTLFMFEFFMDCTKREDVNGYIHSVSSMDHATHTNLGQEKLITSNIFYIDPDQNLASQPKYWGGQVTVTMPICGAA